MSLQFTVYWRDSMRSKRDYRSALTKQNFNCFIVYFLKALSVQIVLKNNVTVLRKAAATLLVEPWLNPPGGPAALILTGWLLACLILQSIYSSNLTACLSIPSSPDPVNTLEDVLSMGKIIYLKERNTVDLYFKDTKDPVINKVKKNLKYVPAFENLDVEILDNRNIVLIKDIGIARYQIIMKGLKTLDYHFASKPLINSYVGWLYSLDLLEAPAMNIGIVRAVECGLTKKWTNVYYAKSAETSSVFSESFQLAMDNKDAALSLSHMQGIFLFWIIGILISTIAFLGEKLVSMKIAAQ